MPKLTHKPARRSSRENSAHGQFVLPEHHAKSAGGSTPRRPLGGNTGKSPGAGSNPIRAPKRRRNRRPTNRKPLFFLIGVAAALAGLVAWALVDPRFDLRQVSVRGAETVSADEIASLVPLPAHRNIFLYYVAHHRAIATHIEQAEPAVEKAGVGIRLPNILKVTIAERQPYALLREGKSDFWVLDDQGVPFRELSSRLPDLPCATLPANSLAPQLGQPLSLDSSTPVGAFYLALHLLSDQRMAVLSKIREFTVDQNANLCLNMSNNLQIRLGQPDELSQKLSLAAAALSSDQDLLERAQYLDLTYPQRPAWKPRSLAVPVTPPPANNAD